MNSINEYQNIEQIKAELDYFSHGSSLLDKAIASIRGCVDNRPCQKR
ncbi:MAG: hypothetical protein PUP90_29080 [Nostoc sp. S4]|nr:hypothetical protein [Nostoc sp. S4]